ncbi:hypothetical protein EVAR_794_1 [Eumeta japonica]|uniref:Uncharacterized protein n=1 Tax=Eumeta variegata TaxID=151549 RepID=A0A4C1SC06_EUMVA|nr:hypothetical protein EVAR_794_1 [Eumeta japonica]
MCGVPRNDRCRNSDVSEGSGLKEDVVTRVEGDIEAPDVQYNARNCRSELPAIDVMHRFNTPWLLLPRVSILRHCDAFVANFTAAEFRALFRTSGIVVACRFGP